ncbi:MAG: SEC-C domain-containing protein, partial [Bryobacterales bacterium]|nr:SEC-C domain-containing protein [Bryobacterales bacterium]
DIDLLLHGPVGAPPAPRAAPRTGRNDYCPCRSGKKFKNCCGAPP